MHRRNPIKERVRDGDVSGARQELLRLLSRQPDNAQNWLLLAELLNEPEQQAECYRRILKVIPHDIEIKVRLHALSRHNDVNSEAAIASSAQSIGRLLEEAVNVDKLALETPLAETPFPGNVPEVALSQPSRVQIPELFDYTTAGEVDEERLIAPLREDLANYVLRELGSGADRNALIRHVCETGDMSWPVAEGFVKRVALENAREIDKRQHPLLLAISIFTLIIGILLAFAGYDIITGLGMIGGGLIGLVSTLKLMRDVRIRDARVRDAR